MWCVFSSGSRRSNLLAEDFISPEAIILKIRIAPAEVSSAPAPRRDRCRDGFSTLMPSPKPTTCSADAFLPVANCSESSLYHDLTKGAFDCRQTLSSNEDDWYARDVAGWWALPWHTYDQWLAYDFGRVQRVSQVCLGAAARRRGPTRACS